MTRPKAPINWDEVDQMLIAGSPGTEIADYYGIDKETLYNRCKKDNNIGFTDYLRQKRSKGDALIRKQQFAKALGLTSNGDTSMMIWLGKNRLGQRDTPIDVEVSKETVKQFSELMTQLDRLQSSTLPDNLSNNSVSSNISE